MSFSTLLLVYIAGGLTFIPILIISALTLSYFAFTQPAGHVGFDSHSKKDIGPVSVLEDGDSGAKSKTLQDEPIVTAAYLAVCREYVPGGINGKPPERSSPAGQVLIAESPSVYQSMYRSIFERGKTQIPTIEGDKKDGKAVKKARNVFFVVLRHGHLMLYDDSDQLEVRHVISLAHHSVDAYGGDDVLSEGDLWIKRNCIRLTRKPSVSKATPSSKPFYFFSDNCSEKEDFYHALLLYQSATNDTDAPPRPQQFETEHMIKLVQQVHGVEADPHSRWLNAIIGRIFLAMYKTADVEDFIRAKINRKISRVSKPNFITSIQILDIDMGDSGPVISNPKLKEMNVHGDTTIEFDLKYKGGFKLQMGAVARIDLGSRLKAREVNLIMAGTLRRLSGHMLVRIKPPPSNRLWMTFETMPHIEMSIEPVVSSRQITYGVILRAIESRIREVLGETIVLPNWDDSPFLDTSRKEYRGGIFESNVTKDYSSEPKAKAAEDHALATAVQELAKAHDLDSEDPIHSSLKETRQKTLSMPSLHDPVQKVSSRKAARNSVVTLAGDSLATATGVSTSGSTTSSPPLPARLPKPMRSSSFASAATPLVNTDSANIETFKPETKSKRNTRGAVDLVKEVNTRGRPQMSSPAASEAESGTEDVPSLDIDRDAVWGISGDIVEDHTTGKHAERNEDQPERMRGLSEPATPGQEIADPGFATPRSPSVSSIPISINSVSPTRSSSQSAPSSSHLSTAASVAKKWGLQVLNRQSTNSPSATTTTPSSSSSTAAFSFPKSSRTSTNTFLNSTSPLASLSHQNTQPHPDAVKAAQLARGEPMGRGQPLPPPGEPLPGPPGQRNSLWSTSNLNLGMKRKPVSAPPLPPRKAEQQKKIPPPLPARNRIDEAAEESDVGNRAQDRLRGDGDSVLVVGAPEDDSSPNASMANSFDEQRQPASGANGVSEKGSVKSAESEIDLPDYSQSAQSENHSHHGDSTMLEVDDTPTLAQSTETIKANRQETSNTQHESGTQDTDTRSREEEEAFADWNSEAQWQEEGDNDGRYSGEGKE